MLHPNQFQVNEAWIVFKLNDAPLRTEQEGSFNCVCLMDAASCFILGNTFVPVHESEPSIIEVRRLLETGWAHKEELPTTLLVPTGQFQTNLPEEVERQGITVVRVSEGEFDAVLPGGEASFQAAPGLAAGKLQLRLESPRGLIRNGAYKAESTDTNEETKEEAHHALDPK